MNMNRLLSDRRPYIILLFVFCFGLVSAQTKMTFVHPGAMNNKVDLDLVKAKVKAGEQPWIGAFNQLKGRARGGTNALKTINSDNSSEAGTSTDEAMKAYANALAWYITGQEIYAKQSIAVLNAWSILQGFNAGTDQDKLQAGWIGALFGPAAEIMRGYSGWQPADIQKVQDMFRRAFYPQLKTVSTWNGNVDLTQIDALMNISVFNEDETEFNLGIQRLKKRNPAYFYLVSDPASSRNYGGSSFKGSWFEPTLIVDGLTQESCRDNNHHTQFAMASALHAAEVAWNQGVDVYTENTQRYIAVMELMATQFLTGKMQGTCSDNVTTGEIFDTWEVGYNHYHNRKELSLPNTERLLKEKVRLKGGSVLNIFFETLTHGEISPIDPHLTYLSSLMDKNARLIAVKFTDKLIIQKNHSAFKVITNNIDSIGITSIEINPADSSILHINLNRDVLINDVISLSWSGSGIISPDSSMLKPFTQKPVEIRLPGFENYITVKIKSKKSGMLIENCTVNFNNEIKTTNTGGEVTFRAFNGQYNLGAEKKHLVTVKNRSLMVSSDTIVTVFLDSTLYKVIFQLEDFNSGSKLSSVDITVRNQLSTTGIEGETYFSLSAGAHLAYFDKINFHSFESEFQIQSDTVFQVSLERSHVNVKFRLKTGLELVDNAKVILGNDSLLTNAVGTCTFKSVPVNGTYKFLIKKENFFVEQGSLNLTKDTVLNLQMSKSVANVEFMIAAASGDIMNAYIILNNDTVWLNATGHGEFFDIPVKQLFTYQIVSDNFQRYSDSLRIEKDTTVQITLKTTGNTTLVQAGDFNVYPNPATDYITIESSKPNIDAIEMYDINGKRILFKDFKSPQISAKVNLNLSPGIYLLKIKSGGEIKSSKIVVK